MPLPKPSPLRRHWTLAPRTVFLNHGSFGACPKAVLRRQAELRAEMEAEPVQFLWRRYDDQLDSARNVLGKFLGANPRDLVFVTNATTAVNAVARSYPLRRGDEVLTTAYDYNACRNVLHEAVARAGAKLVVAPMPFPVRSPDEIVDATMKFVGKRTRLAMIDHVTSDTALIQPVDDLVRELQGRGVDVLIDGAHAPGMAPLDLNRLSAAFYTGNLHKWTCAPKGAAFLWVRKDKQDNVQPAVISHGNNRPRPDRSRFQDRFDWAGTFDPSAWLCVPKALETIGGLVSGGWPEVRRRNHALVVDARRLLGEKLNVEPPCPEAMLGSMATIPLPERFQGTPRAAKIEPEQVELYDRYRIEMPFTRPGPRRCFRISAHVYNTFAEYEYLAECLTRLRSRAAAEQLGC